MQQKFVTKNYKQTQKLGQNFAREILNLPAQKGAVVLALRGNLGGGKTTFLQGFAKGLGIKEKILSPTFVIMKKFTPRGTVESSYHSSSYGWDTTIKIISGLVALKCVDSFESFQSAFDSFHAIQQASLRFEPRKRGSRNCVS